MGDWKRPIHTRAVVRDFKYIFIVSFWLNHLDSQPFVESKIVEKSSIDWI